MRDLMDSAKDAWWLTLIVPLKLVWRVIWRGFLFIANPDLHKKRVDELKESNDWLREENAQLRKMQDGSGIGLANRPDYSPKKSDADL